MYPSLKGKMLHVQAAETALGKPLPIGAEVHHVNGDRLDYGNDNLVICPNRAYHKLLHRREEALDACGNPEYRRCVYCRQWDNPVNMVRNSLYSYRHKKCASDYCLRRYHVRKGNLIVGPKDSC